MSSGRPPEPEEPLTPLRRRIRQGTRGFDFGALINGVPAPTSTTEAQRHAGLPEDNAGDGGRALAGASGWRRRLAGVTSAPPARLVMVAAVPVAGVILALAGPRQPGGTAHRGPVPLRASTPSAVVTLPSARPAGGWPTAARRVPEGPSDQGLRPVASRAAADALREPDPSLTPGERRRGLLAPAAIMPAVRDEVLAAYGLPADGAGRVLCRVVPLEMGGTNGPRNVFPARPAVAQWKARFDRYLLDAMAHGGLTPERAELDLTSDWQLAATGYGIRPDATPSR